MMKISTNDISNKDLARKIDNLVKIVGELVGTTEDLAGMTQRGFLELHAKLDTHMKQSRREHADILFKLSQKVERNELNALKTHRD